MSELDHPMPSDEIEVTQTDEVERIVRAIDGMIDRQTDPDALLMLRKKHKYKLARVALSFIEAARLAEQERAAKLIERRNPNEGGRLDAQAIRGLL